MAIQPVSTIQNQVYQSLKEEISSGSFPPGSKLQEQLLAQQFHVSRSPIREALRKLTSDGLVEEVPNKGVFVRRFTATDIEEIYEIRDMLETQAISHLSRTVMIAREKEFLELLDSMRKAYDAGDLHCYTGLDTQLHRLMVDCCGNSLLGILYTRVECHIQQFRRSSLENEGRFRDSVGEHEQIVQLLLRGNAEEAARVNKIHLLLARDQILKYFAGDSE